MAAHTLTLILSICWFVANVDIYDAGRGSGYCIVVFVPLLFTDTLFDIIIYRGDH